MIPMMKLCDTCKGRGLIPRTRRYIEGVPDPWDTRTEEVCTTCGGGGKVVDQGPTSERQPAAIDHGDCCQ